MEGFKASNNGDHVVLNDNLQHRAAVAGVGAFDHLKAAWSYSSAGIRGLYMGSYMGTA